MTRWQRFFVGLGLSFIFVASDAHATYITIDNSSLGPVTSVRMAFWDLSRNVKLGEIWSGDFPERPSNTFPLDITNTHPLMQWQSYITPRIPWLPDAGFRFGGLDVRSDYGLRRLLPNPALVLMIGTGEHIGIIPGDFNCWHESHVAAGQTILPCSAMVDGMFISRGDCMESGVGCQLGGGVRLAVHAGAPPFNFNGFSYGKEIEDVRAGSPVAVRINYTTAADNGRPADHGFDIFQPGFPASQPAMCTDGRVVLIEKSVPEPVTTSEGALSYDGQDHYTYVWQTPEYFANSCRQLIFRLADGSVRFANFQFR
jgi:hypothetical protein